MTEREPTESKERLTFLDYLRLAALCYSGAAFSLVGAMVLQPDHAVVLVATVVAICTALFLVLTLAIVRQQWLARRSECAK